MNEDKKNALSPVLWRKAGKLTIPILSNALMGTGVWLYRKWSKKTQDNSPSAQPYWLGV